MKIVVPHFHNTKESKIKNGKKNKFSRGLSSEEKTQFW